ncbi:MAG: anaerobic ribonucleoside-triphosphate reductase activating protein [Candidatus Hydrothermarchaeota archaeon]|nr:anaerobic ribonucleoside-triphosphate reductase activating protein [Candidatus Hydrothermarchaeota archaeon]
MLIKGLVKTTLIDYPGKIASTIFLAGCNFRCPYCQNPDLVAGYWELPTISEEEIFGHLKSRKKWLDGVCVSGGEPTLNEELPEFLRKIKSMGFLIKLDTNGTNPEMLKKLLDEKLIDYAAMDIKAPIERYEEVVRARVDLEKIKKSVEIIRNNDVDYEFRTTVVPGLLDSEDIRKICSWLRGSKRYYLQQFRPDVTLDASFRKVAPYKPEEMLKCYNIAKENFKVCEVREI